MRYKNKMLFTKVTCGLLISFLLFHFLTTEASSTNLSTEDVLDQYINDRIKKLGVPGMSVAISHKGELIYSQSFGEEITKETRFYIGSTSKTFTALAVMQLVEQGKIDLDHSVSTYLDDFTVSNKITVRNLLHHLSGMTELDYISSLPPHVGFSDLIEDMNKMSLTYEPGEQFAYFNPNYSLLGAIIESVSGQSYIEYIEDQIINPLGLEHTSVKGEVDTPGHLSFFGFSIQRNEPHIQYDLPAGFITSTSEDLVRFLEALRMKQPTVGVSSEAIEEMMSGHPFYGMGLIISDIAGRPAVHHGGSLPGYTSNAIMLVEDDYSIAFLINKNHLLNGLVFYPDLTNGIVSILTDQEPPSRVNYFWIYRLLIILFAATFIYNMIKAGNMIFRPVQKTVRQRLTAGIVNSAIAVAMIILIPFVVPLIMQRGMTWELAFFLAPDMIAWLFLAIVIHFLESTIHFGFIIKHYFKTKKAISKAS
ncbi:MAG: serine hydrolase domain-containing protein [Anaerobacillus sp.]|uniref:serine hydrolase domain-containing protein n=1 Tax=Anaerobacillus sp. TaxID=1872506 RepID=UPI00391BEE31